MTATMIIAKGAANTSVGQVKQAVGRVLGMERLRAAGRAQVIRGEAQGAIGRATRAVDAIMHRKLAA